MPRLRRSRPTLNREMNHPDPLWMKPSVQECDAPSLVREIGSAPHAGTVRHCWGRLTRRGSGLVLAGLFAIAAGCASSPPKTPAGSPARPAPSREGIDEVHLFGVPVPLNLDAQPGPDGFGITVYASNRTVPKGIAVRKGSLTVLMYDGLPPTGPDRGGREPRRVWTFDPDALKEHAGRSAMGVGYRFALRWGEAVPTGDRITILARYTAPDGRTVSSLPSTLSVAAR